MVGEGAFREVLRARYHGKETAVKLLRGGHFDPFEAACREASMYQVLHALQGSVIPALFGVGRLWFGAPFIATSLIRGSCLADLPSPPPPVRRAARAALSCLHAEGVIHGDLTLWNLMVEEQQQQEGPQQEGRKGEASCRGGEKGDCVVVIVDLGRAMVGATLEQRRAEAARLSRLLQ